MQRDEFILSNVPLGLLHDQFDDTQTDESADLLWTLRSSFMRNTYHTESATRKSETAICLSRTQSPMLKRAR